MIQEPKKERNICKDKKFTQHTFSDLTQATVGLVRMSYTNLGHELQRNLAAPGLFGSVGFPERVH